MSAVDVRLGKSFQTDAREAVKELAAQISGIDPDVLLFFVCRNSIFPPWA
jgi:hypothetical protein